MALKSTSSLISKYVPASARVGSSKLYATAGRPLYKEKSELNDPESIKQLADAVKLINQQDPKTMEKVTDAAEAVKEGAKEVRKTSEFIRDTTKAAADSDGKRYKKEVVARSLWHNYSRLSVKKDAAYRPWVTKMSKTMTEKVVEVAETATGTPKGTIDIAVGAAKKIKDAIVGKK